MSRGEMLTVFTYDVSEGRRRRRIAAEPCLGRTCRSSPPWQAMIRSLELNTDGGDWCNSCDKPSHLAQLRLVCARRVGAVNEGDQFRVATRRA